MRADEGIYTSFFFTIVEKGSIPKFLQNSKRAPRLVPKLQLWNVIALEASLLMTGSMSFHHNCVPICRDRLQTCLYMGTRMMDLQKFGNAPVEKYVIVEK